MKEQLARFGHHPEAEIDYAIEVEELENIMTNERLGHTGCGREAEYEALPSRLGAALDYTSLNPEILKHKADLREIAKAHGFNLLSERAYIGFPVPRFAPELRP